MNAELEKVLEVVAQTQPALDELPPSVLAAIGHDDTVYLLLTRVRDTRASSPILMARILVSEVRLVVEFATQLPGLIYKRFEIEVALQLREQLEGVGTELVFLRPDLVRVRDGKLRLGSTVGD